jgi:hypothetical protein
VLTNPLDVAKTRLQTQSMMVAEEPSVRTRPHARVKSASMSPRFSKPELQVLVHPAQGLFRLRCPCCLFDVLS